MALNDYEMSLEDAKPVYLYAFSLGGRTWRYASSASDVLTTDGRVWSATPISHSGVSVTGEATTDALTIEASTSIAPVQVYMINPPSTPIGLTIFQKDASDVEYVAIYVGDVSQVNFPEPGKATVTCETISVSMRRQGLRLTWQRACPYAVYDMSTCKVNKVAYATPVVVQAVDGFQIQVSGSLTAGIYAGGFFEWTHPVKGLEFLTVEAQSGNTLTVFGTTVDLYPGLPITLYRGCNRTPAACASFGNFDNYGGVPAMPGKSPFDGTPVF
jgi:uncharacterized phage protein (TIGR02218 family)